MFGLEFLFASALWALPLAGLPILLHLLFRRKSPIVPFSTLRFVKAAIQQTAARKRVQRWLLLACRVLLLLLLIWAIAQPAKMLASSWMGGSKSTIAAIVVDTSYSMLLEDQQVSLMDRASSIVQDLMRNQLADARVAIFRSNPPAADQPEQLRTTSQIQSEWTGLKPEPAPVPLADRIASAKALLERQDAEQKWLVILTDLQTKEFPRPVAQFEGGRVILLDLHPDEARSAGVTRVSIHPEQPIPGLPSEAVVEVAGRAGDTRAVTLSLTRTDGTNLWQSSPLMANLDTAGRTQTRFPIKLPAERWLLATGSLGVQDALPWDNTRSHLIEVPPRQVVTLMQPASPPPALRFIRLALDPSEGKLPAWPIDVRRGAAPTGEENVYVAALTQWPDEPTAQRMHTLARGGGTVILFLQPGLEQSWESLTAQQKEALTALLPTAPAKTAPAGAYRASLSATHDPLMQGLDDPNLQINNIVVRRFVAMSTTTDPSVTTILSIAPIEPGQGARSYGLLFRKSVGTGAAYTFATLPESRYASLGTHALFLPLMVRMSLASAQQSAAQNVELGQPLMLSGPRYAGIEQLEVETPKREVILVSATEDPKGRRFAMENAAEPGIYTWRRRGDDKPIAMSNVQLPGAEADLSYREANSVVTPGPNVLVARSLDDLQSKMATVSEPSPRWSGMIALVLFLICMEAMMGSISKLWKPISLRLFLPGFRAAPATTN